MARPSLFHHRKFRTLARRLGSRAVAVGSLELLWAVANDAGDPLIGSAEDVEDVADWKGDAGDLVAALLATRFLDRTEDGFAVHDHAHHCPGYVRRRRDREKARRENGASVASQQHASDAPLTPTPNTQHPTPISQHPTPTPEPRPSVLADDVWQLWRTVADEHGAPVRLGASHTQTTHLMALAGAYTLDELGAALRAWWASPFVTGRNLGLFVSQVDEVLAHVASGSRRAFREPVDKAPARAPAQVPYRSHVDWVCPHEPHCGARRACELRRGLDAAKAKAAVP